MALVNTLATNAAPFVHPQEALKVTGQRVKEIVQPFTTTASDSNASIYFLGEVPDIAVILSIRIHTADIASASSCDIGLYDMNGVAKVDDYYAAGIDSSSHSGLAIDTYASSYNHPGTTNVAVTKAADPVWKNAGDVEGPYPASGSTIRGGKYQIGLLFDTGASAAISGVATIRYACAE